MTDEDIAECKDRLKQIDDLISLNPDSPDKINVAAHLGTQNLLLAILEETKVLSTHLNMIAWNLENHRSNR